MPRLIALTLLLAAYSIGTTASNHTVHAATVARFHKWAAKHDMEFHESQKAERMRIFAKNLDKIQAHNKKKRPYKLKLNKFAHLTFTEFSGKYLGLKAAAGYKCENLMSGSQRAESMNFTHANVAAPAQVDWRKRGAVTPIKDQGECGESFMGTVEATQRQGISTTAVTRIVCS